MDILDILKKMRWASSPSETLQEALIEALNKVTSLDWCLVSKEGKDHSSSELVPLLLADLENLTQALKHNTSVKRLDLRGHQVGDIGMHILAKMLRENTTLTSLFIEGNQITDNGLFHLLNELHFNKTLLNLDPEQESTMRPHGDLSQRFWSDYDRISHINNQIRDVRSNRMCTKWSWHLGNQLSIKRMDWRIELLLFNRLQDAKLQLEKSRKMNDSIHRLSETLTYEQIKTETISGALLGAAVAGTGTFLGIVGGPTVLPIVFSLGILRGGIAALKSTTTSFPKATRIIHTQIESQEKSQAHESLSFEKEALEDEPIFIKKPEDSQPSIMPSGRLFYRR